MTYLLKAFVTNATYINNTPGTIAPFGELSPYSLSFSLEVGLYSSTTTPGLTLYSFTSQTDGVNNAVDSGLATRVLTISQWIYAQTTAQSGQIFADQLLSQLLIQFSSIANTFSCGSILSFTLANGAFWIPEYVSWVDVATGAIVKIWFVDQSFQTQYDDYTIVVIPPFTPLNNFFTGATKVAGYLNAVTYPDRADLIQAAANGKPYTRLRAETFSYIDPSNNANTLDTQWTVIIYGPEGDNVDSISDALVSYCLENSDYTQAQWAAILPDIFLRTEFMYVPLWDQIAIPETSLVEPKYSPQANLKRVIALIKSTIPSYDPTHIDNYLNLMSYPYRSLQIATIGSVNNKNAWYELIDVYPDIISVVSTTSDFAYMSESTQQFLLYMQTMLIAAETMTANSTLPAGFTRVTRDNKLYIVLNYQNIHHLVLAKNGLTPVITGVEST